MTPKDKAKELLDKFEHLADDYGTPAPVSMAKECAIISINETIKHLRLADGSLKVKWEIIFLRSVKEEINKL